MSDFIRLDFDAFCERSGCDKEELFRVVNALPPGAWIAGGAVRRTLIKQPLDSDFDFFFRDEAAMQAWESLLPPTLKLIRETEHHKHWRGPVGDSALPVDIQAIRFRWYESAEAVIDSFDYTITQFCIDSGALVTTPEAIWDLGRKRLAIHRVTYPVATMRRMLKYTKQGFTACAGCMATLLRETAQSPEALAFLDIKYVD